VNSTETPGGSGIPAGWYDDPSGAGLRWWDGEQWTEHVHTAESAAAATGASPEGEREAPPPELVKLRESIRGRGAKGVGIVLGGLVVVIVVVALLLSGGSDSSDAGQSGNPVPSAAKTAKAAATKLQIKAIDRQLKKKGLSKAARKRLVAQKKKLETSAKGSKSAKQGKAAKGKAANSKSGKGTPAKGTGAAAKQKPTPGGEGN
jgi:Protein of unknown function (DUF2510)